jgi:hypothetical protein
MTEDRYAVLRHGDVGLDRGNADRERPAKRRERVLRREAARPAVALEVERVRAARREREQERDDARGQCTTGASSPLL